MKNFVLDNSLKNLGKVVLWQYDKAYRLLALLKHMQVLFHVSVERFWQYWIEHILSIEACGEFGCTLWSQLLGVARPSIVDGSGNKRFISAQVFRRVLKGHFFLLKATPSIENISTYLEIVFGIPGRDSISKWVENVSEYGWYTNVKELNSDIRPVQQYHVYKDYDKGSIFQFAPTPNDELKNWEVLEDISSQENTSWDAITSKVSETEKEADYSTKSEMIVLKLYDPNGFCRKMAGASSDSLSIGLSYVFGTTTISATISRSRKSGVVVVDDGDMAISYAKSEYFDLMLPDQKYLYEQYKDTLLPYPIGIKSNEPVEEVIFGFEGQQDIELYEPNRDYEKGHIFGYVNEEDGSCFNWECKEAISSSENKSFEAISGKVKKTKKGDPFVGQLVDVLTPYFPAMQSYKVIPFYYADDIYANSADEALAIAKKWAKPLESLFPDGFNYVMGWWDTYRKRTTCELDIAACSFDLGTLTVGRYKDIIYIYKIPLSEGDGKILTDGKTFGAVFDINLRITTPKMPTYDYAVKNHSPFSIGHDEYIEYGILDAIGNLAHYLRWEPIATGKAILPIKGCYYKSDVGFEYDNGLFYNIIPTANWFRPGEYQGELNLKKVEPTSFISNSTIQAIKNK